MIAHAPGAESAERGRIHLAMCAAYLGVALAMSGAAWLAGSMPLGVPCGLAFLGLCEGWQGLAIRQLWRGPVRAIDGPAA